MMWVSGVLSLAVVVLAQPPSTVPLTGATVQAANPNVPHIQPLAVGGLSVPNLGVVAKPITADTHVIAPVEDTLPSFNAGHAVSSMLGGEVESPSMQAQGVKAMGPDTMAVVSGVVEAFLAKVTLLPGEKKCLKANLGEFTGDIMGTVGDIVTTVKALVEGKGTVNKNRQGALVSAGIDSALKITSLVTLCTKVMDKCVHQDALNYMHTAAAHLKDADYINHRFIVNGVDIAHDLADGIIAFQHKDFYRFGRDLGTSLRQILLSNSGKGIRTALPEGVPDQEIIQEATDGLMRGFFVRGSAIEITSISNPRVDILVNLHTCIAGNGPFFKELWMSLWDLIAQCSANAQQHDLGLPVKSLLSTNFTQQGQPKWSGELVVAMMQFPMAMAKCGASPTMQTMLAEAIKSINDVRVDFKYPKGANFQGADEVKTGLTKANTATANMATAVQAWTDHNFENFGYRVGCLIRELVLEVLPQKYSVDDSGVLQRYSKKEEEVNMGKQLLSMHVYSVVLGVAGFSLLFALAVMRIYRSAADTRRQIHVVNIDSYAAMCATKPAETDLEDGDADGAFE